MEALLVVLETIQTLPGLAGAVNALKQLRGNRRWWSALAGQRDRGSDECNSLKAAPAAKLREGNPEGSIHITVPAALCSDEGDLVITVTKRCTGR